MLKRKKNVNFDKIRKIIELVDITLGGYLLKESSGNKKTLKEKWFKLTIPRHISETLLLFISTLFVTHFKLLSIILVSSGFLVVFKLYFTFVTTIQKKDTLKGILKWCDGLYDVENQFDKKVQKIAETHLFFIEKRTVKMWKWFAIILYMDVFAMTLGSAIIGTFVLPDNIYPKFSSPMPLYLPFRDQETWLAFGTTVMVLTTAVFDTCTLNLLNFGIMYTIALHILGYLDIIKEAVEKVKQEMLLDLNTPHEIAQPSTSTIQMDVLAAINATTSRGRRNSESFTEWIPILTDMISDVNYIISSYGKLYSKSFFLLEIGSLAALFICGLIFTVIKQQQIFAIGITISCAVLFTFCYIHEKILEKLDEINEGLYDLPWYVLDPKKRQLLLIELNCDKIQHGFTAAGIHPISLERFGIVVKAGYTNMIVLKDLIMK